MSHLLESYALFNTAQLENKVRKVIASIDVNILHSVLANLLVCIGKCIESGGGNVESWTR